MGKNMLGIELGLLSKCMITMCPKSLTICHRTHHCSCEVAVSIVCVLWRMVRFELYSFVKLANEYFHF